MGSALASGGSILEPAGIGSVGCRGSFWQLLTEATPVVAPLPKPCYANPIQPVIYLFLEVAEFLLPLTIMTVQAFGA